METTTSIDAVKGEQNIYDLDADVAIGVNDLLRFVLKHAKSGAAIVTKNKGAGITVTDAANGKFQVVLDPADLASILVTNSLQQQVPVRALIYEATLDSGGGGNPQLVTSGVCYLVDA